VVDARIGVLRGIDAVYYSLTLPSAKFEFSGTAEAPERTINQPWTQVVLEGLRRLDEGVVPTPAFPENYADNDGDSVERREAAEQVTDFEPLRVPGFLTFVGKESMTRRKSLVAGGVVVAVLLSVAAIGVPAGWYGRPSAAAVVQPPTQVEVVAPPTSVVPEVPADKPEESVDNAAAVAAKPQRDKERTSRDEKLEAQKQANPVAPTVPATNTTTATTPKVAAEKSGPKKVTVTVTYDESGRVTQASGGDASAVRIARQKRFPAGKAGSATVTIPIN
jgi:hypothetical protein